MKKAFAIAWVSCVVYLLCSCLINNGSLADGGGSDQPNRLVVGYVNRGDGIPQVSARVRLYSGRYRTGYEIGLVPDTVALEAEVRTNNKGEFAFKPYRGDHFIEAVSADSDAISITPTSPLTKDSANLGTIDLEDGASLKGTVVSVHPVKAMLLAGTHFQTIPDVAGNFHFRLLPAGNFRLVARMGDEFQGQLVPVATVDLKTDQDMDLDTVIAEPNQIMMFNFDIPGKYSSLRGLTFPYTQKDTNSLLGAWYPLPQELDSTTAFRNKSVHLNLAIKGPNGFSMGLGYQDLSKMTALSFWAKGNGPMMVYFHSQIVVTGDSTFRARVNLTPEWVEYHILASDIVSPSGAAKNYYWDRGKSRIGKITFGRASALTTDVWLDEIRLQGLTYLDLGLPTPAGIDALPNR